MSGRLTADRPARLGGALRKRRNWVLSGLLAVLLVVLMVVPWPRHALWGWLRGEKFYRGYPTSYWAGAIRSWEDYRSGSGKAAWQHWIETKLGIVLHRGSSASQLIEGDPESVAVLRDLLRHDDPDIRNWACSGLACVYIKHKCDDQFAGPFEEIIPELEELLRNGTQRDQWNALYLIAHLGPRACDSIPLLETKLACEDPHLRIVAAQALLTIDPERMDALDILVEGLRSEQKECRRDAAYGLAFFLKLGGAEAKPKLQARRDLLQLLEKLSTDRNLPYGDYATGLLEQLEMSEIPPAPDK